MGQIRLVVGYKKYLPSNDGVMVIESSICEGVGIIRTQEKGWG